MKLRMNVVLLKSSPSLHFRIPYHHEYQVDNSLNTFRHIEYSITANEYTINVLLLLVLVG
jgi:hypothetical protein